MFRRDSSLLSFLLSLAIFLSCDGRAYGKCSVYQGARRQQRVPIPMSAITLQWTEKFLFPFVKFRANLFLYHLRRAALSKSVGDVFQTTVTRNRAFFSRVFHYNKFFSRIPQNVQCYHTLKTTELI